uniref:Tc1-like transposase DDE domain-containing protein n=1 Tax=Takifugu rubripes TaxID=31033 RepID=A0A674NEM2_TAKRU
LLVHNNARPHVARVCRQFRKDEGINTIDWPPRSPDVNPIEHLWDIMFRPIRRRQVDPQTVQELTCPGPGLGEDPPGHNSSSH